MGSWVESCEVFLYQHKCFRLAILGECGVLFLARRGTGEWGTLCGRSGCCGQPLVARIATYRAEPLQVYS